MEELDLNNLTKDDFMEMAKYVAHTEAQNRVLVEQLREAKANLTAVVHQRNSLNAKLQYMVNEKINTVDVQSTILEVKSDLENPEMYRVPKERLGLSPKEDRI